jgi:tetratricopeptide (TPR) repeat protein
MKMFQRFKLAAFLLISGMILLPILSLGALLTVSTHKSIGQPADKKSDKTANAAEAKVAAGLLVGQAEQAESESDFETALKYYTEVKIARPKWAAVQFKISVCLATLDKKEEAANALREVLKMKSASPELLSQARVALQELLLPELSDKQRQDWKQALSLIQAGEELKQHESEDSEIRIEHKVFAGPYQEAIKRLEKLTKDKTRFAPAFLSLGAAHENLLHFLQAANAYRKFLEFGSENKLPELEQQAQIRQRIIVCERRHQADVDIAKRILGIWQLSYEHVEEPSTTTIVVDDKTSRTFTSGFRYGGELELRPGGKVNRREGSGWKWDKDAYWKVVNKQLIVGGLVGTPSEWCNLGQLTPSGHRFEGLNMDLGRTRYTRKGD